MAIVAEQRGEVRPEAGRATDVSTEERLEVQRIENQQRAREAGISFPADVIATPPPPMILAGVLPREGFGLVYGASGSGKTALVTDLGACISRRLPWRGRRVNPGGLVVYFASENPASAKMRVRAIVERDPDAGAMPLAIVGERLSLGDAKSVKAAIEYIKLAEAAAEKACVVAVVDTLAASMAGLDENVAREMTAATNALHRIRDSFGGLVIAVHHTGKNAEAGARGSSALRAAADTEIAVESIGPTRVATVTKQRDLESGARFGFVLEQVEIGRDPDTGLPYTSIVVKHVDDGEIPSAAPVVPVGKNQTRAIAAVRAWYGANSGATHITPADLNQILTQQGLDRHRRAEAREFLTRVGALTAAVGGYTINEDNL